MRRFLIAFLLVGALGQAQSIKYTPPAGGGSFTTPGAGIIVDTDGSGTLAGRTLTAGASISIANGAGAAANPTISLDSATTISRSQGTADPPATCVAQAEIYTETDEDEVYFCVATNTWVLLNDGAGGGGGLHAQHGVPVQRGDVLPASVAGRERQRAGDEQGAGSRG